MEKCGICNKEYDPEMDFVEDIELLEALQRYIDIDTTCSECVYEIDDKISDFVNQEINNGLD